VTAPETGTRALLLVREDREYLLEPGETLETDLGVLEVPEDAAPGDVVETHLGERFAVRRLRGPDLFEQFERSGAPMLPRDVGLVMGLTGVAVGDRVLDAGTGTGVLAAYLARAGAAVRTYERDPDAARIARENTALAGVADAVDVHTGDVTAAVEDLIDGNDGATFDLITLDTADAPAVAERAPELLVPGGYLAAYVPFVEGTRSVIEAARDGLREVRAVETIQRELDVDERGTRPSTAAVGHTGYLVVGRAPDAPGLGADDAD